MSTTTKLGAAIPAPQQQKQQAPPEKKEAKKNPILREDEDTFNTGSSLFSENVDKALNDVLTTTDVFDDPAFNPVDYINQNFPNEQSLANIDAFSVKLKQKIKNVDEEIVSTVRKQSTSGVKAKQDLQEAKRSIQGLFGKINDIKNKAAESENMVQELCKDIKSLDFAKRHLTATIKALQRLHLLVSALDQLKIMTTKRQYNEAAKLLQAVNGLSAHFESYKDIPKINELKDGIAVIKKTLQRQIFDDFRSLDAIEANHPHVVLADACLVINALGEDVRKELVKQFVDQQINIYKMLFRPGQEVSNLENIHKRFAWLKRQLKTFEERYGGTFPRYWSVPQEISIDFCLTTREDICTYLRDNKDALEVSILLRALSKTMEFEKDLQNKFGSDVLASAAAMDEPEPVDADPNLEQTYDPTTAAGIKQKYQNIMRQQRLEREREERLRERQRREQELRESREQDGTPADFVPSNYRFIGLISHAFEEYMDVYVKFEDRNMGHTIQNIVKDETWEPTDERSDVIESSRDIFIYVKESLKKCGSLSRGRTLYYLYEVWKKYLKMYAGILMDKLPKPTITDAKDPITGQSLRLSEKDENTIIYIINSCEYCISNISGLEEKLRETIDEEYKKRIDMASVVEDFSGVINRAVTVLIIGMQTRFEPALGIMTRTNWATWDSVGDQSEYVTMICQILTEAIPTIGAKLSRKYFKFFCDKFVASFLPFYIAHIYKCKRISETGAQQLLLDAQSFKKYLKELPNINEERFPPASLTSYSKLVSKETAKAERMLKLLLTPQEQLTERYKSLYTTSSEPTSPNPAGKTANISLNPQSLADLQKIMELKGMKKSEQTAVIEEISKEIQKKPGVGGALSSISSSSSLHSNISEVVARSAEDSKFIKLLNNTFGL